MRKIRLIRLLAPAAAIVAVAALSGCAVYPGAYGFGYGYGVPGYYGTPYAYAPTTVFGFGGWHDRDWHGGWR